MEGPPGGTCRRKERCKSLDDAVHVARRHLGRCLHRRLTQDVKSAYRRRRRRRRSLRPRYDFSSQEQPNPRRLVADISRAIVHGAKDLEVLGRHSAGTRTSRARRRGPLILVFEARVLCALAVFVAFLAVDLFR